MRNNKDEEAEGYSATFSCIADNEDCQCTETCGGILMMRDAMSCPEDDPFSPEDDGITVYDQEGNAYRYFSRTDKESAYVTLLCNPGFLIHVEPSGTTETAIKITRHNPKL